MNGFIGLCVVVLLVWCFCSGSSRTSSPRMRMTYHACGNVSAARVKKHEEGGHKRAAARLGCHGKVVEHRDGGYEFKPTGGRWGKLSPVEQAAIYYAGRAAAGPGGHQEDDKGAEWWLNRYPRRERAARTREAWRLAERLVR